MAIETDMGGDNNDLFIGEDKIFEHYVDDEDGVPIDCANWTPGVVKLTIRKADGSADPPIFELTGSLQGIYDTDPNTSTQRWVATLTDTQTATLKAIDYRYSWKRFDDGVETVLGFGNFTPKLVTSR